MTVDRLARLAVLAGLALLVQAGMPGAVAHGGGHTTGSGADGDGTATGFRLTPDRPFVEQLNPHVDGPRVVWQERAPGEDWEIHMANLTGNVTLTRLTNTDFNESNPIVEDHWVAWRAFDPGEGSDLVVLDVSTGSLQHVPDSGQPELFPSFADNGTLYYKVHTQGDHGLLRGFDPRTGEVFKPIGNQTIVGEPSAYGDRVAWAEGSKVNAKFHIRDMRTGKITEVPNLYNLEDGPELGPSGLAWIARYGGQFDRGTYTTVYDAETGVDRIRSSVYPHKHLEHCNAGVVWSQPGTADQDRPVVALHDRFIDGTVTFDVDAFDGACGFDHLVYEKNTQGDPDSEAGTRQVFGIDLDRFRLPREADIQVTNDFERSLLRHEEEVVGTAVPGDPREPIEQVLASIDGGPTAPIAINQTEDGVVWRTKIDPRAFDSGRHELKITAVDEQGRPSSETFVFYAETPYNVGSSDQEGPIVPREGESPFPLSVFNHYQDYQPFYNTVVLVLVIVLGGGWYLYKRRKEKPPGRPEYVPPDDPYA